MTRKVSNKGRPTIEVSKQKLEQILDVARDQFADRGYRAVTVRGVAEAAQVSTRTLYNRYADKLTLFTACLDTGAAMFPRLEPAPGEDVAVVLRRHAATLVKVLSTGTSVRLGMLIYREGADFPELLRASEANQDRYLVQPLAGYLRRAGLESEGSDERAKLFIAMAISEWQRSVTFKRPLPNDEAVDRHAALAVRVFLNGTWPLSLS